MELNQNQISLLLNALNSHEGAVATDYERAVRLNSTALAAALSRDLNEIRVTALALAAQLHN